MLWEMCINLEKKIDDSKSSSIDYSYRYYLLADQMSWCLLENWASFDFLKFQPTLCLCLPTVQLAEDSQTFSPDICIIWLDLCIGGNMKYNLFPLYLTSIFSLSFHPPSFLFFGTHNFYSSLPNYFLKKFGHKNRSGQFCLFKKK